MDIRMKELIAIGASITANCHPCIKYHVAKAKENGVCEDEIREAIAVGVMVRKGAAGKMDELVPNIFEAASEVAGEPDKECGGQ